MVIGILSKTTEDLGGAFSAERIAFALKMTLLGIGAVFAVLALIWLVLALFKFFLYDLKNNKERKVKSKSTNNAASVEAEKEPEVASVVANNTSDDATVAAIMAAISAYISEDPELSREYAGGFRVVSFKRARAKASWNNINN